MKTIAKTPTVPGFYWAEKKDNNYVLVEVRSGGAIFFMGWDCPEYNHSFVGFIEANLIMPNGKAYRR